MVGKELADIGRSPRLGTFRRTLLHPQTPKQLKETNHMTDSIERATYKKALGLSPAGAPGEPGRGKRSPPTQKARGLGLPNLMHGPPKTVQACVLGWPTSMVVA